MDPLARIDVWPVDVAAAGVTDAGSTLSSRGTGASMPIASVTKVLTAAATLVAVGAGHVELDEPAGPPDATVRHLLAHASGLPPGSTGRPVPVGSRRIYSNRGFEVLAELVAEHTGEPFESYLERRVLKPLGLEDTRLAGSPAHGARSTCADLLALGREWLSPDLLDPGLHAAATTVAFPGLEGVLPGFGPQHPNDWGLGVEIRDGKHPHWTGRHNHPRTYGHFGQSGAFLWIDPVAELACAFVGDREFGPWAARSWPPLSDGVLAEHRTGRR